MSRSRSNSLLSVSTAAPKSTIALDEYAMKVSAGETDGAAYGELLAQRAAQIMLMAYNDRRQPITPASDAWAAAQERLESVLGVMVNDPRVSQALKDVDDAHGNAQVEIEDRAWHAAWTVAMSLKGGNS